MLAVVAFVQMRSRTLAQVQEIKRSAIGLVDTCGWWWQVLSAIVCVSALRVGASTRIATLIYTQNPSVACTLNATFTRCDDVEERGMAYGGSSNGQ